MKNAIAVLLIFIICLPVKGQDVTSDTTAIRAILRANGISDTVHIKSSTFLPPPCYFAQGGRVVSLVLTGLGLNSLSSEIGMLDGLNDLSVNRNSLTSLPPEIGNLTKLTLSLILDNNSLTSLPPEIGNLTKLRILGVSNNQLASLPSQIGNLKALTDFNLSNNLLTSLPIEIGDLTQSVGITFNFSNNKLTKLPSTFGNIGGTSGVIYLNDNLLDSLPASIGNLRVAILNLRNNQLASLPNELGNAANLGTLRLNNNKLAYLPDSIGNLSKLGGLYLSDNLISSLPKSFMKLHMSEWDMQNNQLTDLPWSNDSLPSCCGAYLNVDNNRLCGLDSTKHNLVLWLDFNSSTPNWGISQRCGGNPVVRFNVTGSGFDVIQYGSSIRIRSKKSGYPFTASICDSKGRRVAHLQGQGGEAVWSWSRSQKGVYLIRLKSSRESVVRRVAVY